ncbi:MAG: guanine deaminase [Myxococcales bacterium]|nr:guanine deaminase [Myxococcales bacterium]|tara:strand:+ start:551 stop:1858 length:1308 start_codon:yes stop_codon:yes gene_type:complete
MSYAQPSELHLGRIVNPRPDGTIEWFTNGALAINDRGQIVAVGPKDELQAQYPEAASIDHRSGWIVPGFVDTHVHLSQIFGRARVRGELLRWLDDAIFPVEQAFADPNHADKAARSFVSECARSGITTANIFLTSHPEASQQCFQVVADSGLRAIMGMVQMDQDAPADLCLDVGPAIDATTELASRWHDYDGGRIRYALMPRFALSCSKAMLQELGRIQQQMPDLHMHTHVAENETECKEVQARFPEASDYLSVYADHGLVHKGTLLAHGIHLADHNLQKIQTLGAGVSHCPSSNMFLKSGVFPVERYLQFNTAFGLGTDVGAGPELCPFAVMRSAYNIQPDYFWRPADLFWRATLGGAQALGLDATIGCLSPGKDADFVVLQPDRLGVHAPSMPTRDPNPEELDDLLSPLIFLGDDRLVEHVRVRGRELAYPGA